MNQDHKGQKRAKFAIVGVGCRFPGVSGDVESLNEFFDLLLSNRSPIGTIPEARWKLTDVNLEGCEIDNISRLNYGAFLTNIDGFDANFFKISPTEAKQIDPQQRVFLETAVHALNHANITRHQLQGHQAGVFCGIATHEYEQLNAKEGIIPSAYTPIGIATSAAAGRLSHYLDITGPSMIIDTACTSSLSALHVAAQSLTTKSCDTAIVGGIHLNICPENYLGLAQAKMISASGQLRSFDKDADGYIRSEGCAVVIIRTLDEAIAANNNILAVIETVATTHEGAATKISAPDRTAQEALHRQLLTASELRACDIDYIETHGTATKAGDPAEFGAIETIHRGQHKTPLVIGAVKSILGHTLSCSGFAGILKVIGSFQQQVIPANLHFQSVNEQLHPEQIPAILPVDNYTFPIKDNQPRYAQVLNFGFSGSNAGVILSDYRQPQGKKAQPPLLTEFLFSAESEYSLEQYLRVFSEMLKSTELNLSDIAYTLVNGRDQYRYRCVISAESKAALLNKISDKQYQLTKVSIDKMPAVKQHQDLSELTADFLAGKTVVLKNDEHIFQSVDIPQYQFERKSFWRESQKQYQLSDRFKQLHTKSVAAQKQIFSDVIFNRFKPYAEQKTFDLDSDFSMLDLDDAQIEALETAIRHDFQFLVSLPRHILSPHMSITKLVNHIHLLVFPQPVMRQPVVETIDNDEPIAIVGMSARFPKSVDIVAFAELLENGVSGMQAIPKSRWDNEKYYSDDVAELGKLYVKEMGFINDVENFDAGFFKISPREAKLMSPQLRIFMEESYHALEHANIALEDIKGSQTGVFVGIGTNEYPRLLAVQGVNLEDLNIYFATGNVLNALAGRVAYAFDFHGPIQVIDTACSSSMTAIHNACISLKNGDCNMALAGGINIVLCPDSNVTLSKARMLAVDSRCKTFSEDADGYARSEGCGILVLKRLSQAQKDQDKILAIIKGSAINSDGQSGGFTVPNGTAQEAVIRRAMAKAKLNEDDIDYIEAHGTGTPLADPIEMNTLERIFQSRTGPALQVSSVKTNIGHCESASGVAGVIKAVLSLQQQTIYKHLNFSKLNPDIILDKCQIPFNKIHQAINYVGVSSFGFSGANGHLILQHTQSEKQVSEIIEPTEAVLTISAKSKTALKAICERYENYLCNKNENWLDICYTAANCRAHYDYRVGIIAKDKNEAVDKLRAGEYEISEIKIASSNKHQIHPFNLKLWLDGYLAGENLDWKKLYNHYQTTFNKVDLPLYAFERTRHWFEDRGKIKNVPIKKDFSYKRSWKVADLDLSNTASQTSKNWGVWGDITAISALQNNGVQVKQVTQAWQQLRDLDGLLWIPELTDNQNLTLAQTVDFQKASVERFLKVLQFLSNENISLPIWIITRKACAELTENQYNYLLAPLIGFAQTAALELPQFSIHIVDLEHREFDQQGCLQIIKELQFSPLQNYEHYVCYRASKRYVMRIKPFVPEDFCSGLSPNRRYIVSGGTGGLGLVSAEALLGLGAKEVIILARNIDTPLLLTKIDRLKKGFPGREITLRKVDIADESNVAQLFEELNATGGLHGIIHAAGAVVKKSIILTESNDIDLVFDAKVKGAWLLHQYSLAHKLDFFTVYSSISSVFGSNKEAVYAASNSAIDALIAYRHNLGVVGNTINWGPWADVGMAKKRSSDHYLKQASLSTEQGMAWLKMILSSFIQQISIISPDYLKIMLDFVPSPMTQCYQALSQVLKVETEQQAIVLTDWLKSYSETSSDKRQQHCQDMLVELCLEILELSDPDEIELDDGFFEMGFDSLMISELAMRLKKQLAPVLNIAVNVAFDHPTIEKLTSYLHEQLQQKLQSLKTENAPQVAPQSIAVIGMSCNFPGAGDLSAFESLLENELDPITPIPISRWDNDLYFDPTPGMAGKSYVDRMGCMDNITRFDAEFFGISPREAKFIEPQQKIFLEQCYAAIENANYKSSQLRGSLTGVFAGVGPNEYFAHLAQQGLSTQESSGFSITGNVINLIPGRVAYTFDLKGPSLTLDTACSSSLVAIHYACQSLKNGESNLALAGGVNVLLDPKSNITLSQARALSPEGKCKTFDATADGYVRGEGCGVLLLKRLADAIKDQDEILAVIEATAVNNDGKCAGLTVPNGQSQVAVMQQALMQTKVQADQISYIEAHGSATPLGDPIEVNAINSVYGKSSDTAQPLYLGCVKTQIGHLESASGVAGIIKAIISLQNKKLYPLKHFNKANPYIKFSPSKVTVKQQAWNVPQKKRYAAVNAFGFSGTNAHAIVGEAPAKPIKQPSILKSDHYLVLSAKSVSALNLLIEAYCHFLSTTQQQWCDICFTAATCREHYDYRLVVIADDKQLAIDKLTTKNYYLSFEPDDKQQQLAPEVQVYLSGETQDWQTQYRKHAQHFSKVVLPNYTFDRKELFLTNPSVDKQSSSIACVPNDQWLGAITNLATGHLFQLSCQQLLNNYQVAAAQGQLPIAALIDICMRASQKLLAHSSISLSNIEYCLPINMHSTIEVQLQSKCIKAEIFQLALYAYQGVHWHKHIETVASVCQAQPNRHDLQSNQKNLNSTFREELSEKFKPAEMVMYEQFIDSVYRSDDKVYIHFNLSTIQKSEQYIFAAPLFDIILQCAVHFFISSEDYQHGFIIDKISAIQLHQSFSNAFGCVLSHDPERNSFDIRFVDENGYEVICCQGISIKHRDKLERLKSNPVSEHLYAMQWQPYTHHTKQFLPIFGVFAVNETVAKKCLPSLPFQFIDINTPIEQYRMQHLIIIYDQLDLELLLPVFKNLFSYPFDSLVVVTRDAFSIQQLNTVDPRQTLAASFIRVFFNELDKRENLCHIDLPALSNLEAVLKSHWPLTENSIQQFAYRDKQLWQSKLQAINFSNTAILPTFDAHAWYVITGGSGGLAKYLIEYLVQRGAKKIALLSRNALQKENREGIMLEHFCVDVADKIAMTQVFETLSQNKSSIKGIFHLAGCVNDGLIPSLNWEEQQAILRSKVEGSWNLHQLTQHLELDHFVLFSSSATLLAPQGQSIYAAANGFLDGLSHYRQSLNLCALTINWGPFDNIGMTQDLTQFLKAKGYLPMAAEDLEVLDCVLTSGLPQVMICPVQWRTYLAKHVNQSFLSDLVERSTQLLIDTQSVMDSSQLSEQPLELVLKQIIIDILHLADDHPITQEQDLYALGMDSLMLLELRHRIHDHINQPALSLPVEFFITQPSIAQLLQRIEPAIQQFEGNSTHSLLSPTEQPSTVELPLCDFQFGFWIMDQFKWSYNIGTQYSLSGLLDIDYVQQAFEYVIKHHPAFWLAFDPNLPMQHFGEVGEFSLDYVDLSEKGSLDLDKIFQQNMGRLIPLKKAPLIRVHLYKLAKEQYQLHVILPHIIVDDRACLIVFEGFMQCYQQLLVNQPLALPANTKHYLDFVYYQQQHFEIDLQKKIEFWQRYNNNVQLFKFDAHYLQKTHPKNQPYLHHFQLSTSAVREFFNWHAANNVNISSGLIAATHYALSQMGQQSVIPVILHHSGREGSEFKNVMGSFSEQKPLNLAVSVNQTVSEAISEVDKQLLKTAPYQKCSQLIKSIGILEQASWWVKVMNSDKRAALKERFELLTIAPILKPYYVKYFDFFNGIKLRSKVFNKLNRLFKPFKFQAFKPDRVRILLTITPSFFYQSPKQLQFADINYRYASHFGFLNRFMGSKALAIYFSKDQDGNYLLSINGPITQYAKQQLAEHVIDFIEKTSS